MRIATMAAAVLLGIVGTGTVKYAMDRAVVAAQRDPRVVAARQIRSAPVRPRLVALQSVSTAVFSFAPMEKYQALNGGAYVTFETVAVADVSGDHRDDLVAATWQGELYIFLQNAQGGLDPPRIETQHSSEFVLADFNEDGVLDIGSRNLLLSDGPGRWKFRAGSSELMETEGWTALDVDNDGHLDLVGFQAVPDYTNGAECGQWSMSYCPRYVVAHGDGAGGFVRVTTVKLGQPYFISGAGARDLNGDGFKDLAMVLMGDPYRPGKVLVQYHDRRAGLLPPVEVHRGYEAGGGITFGDFNADARVDSVLVPADQALYPEVRLREPDGTFAFPLALPSQLMRTNWPLAADFDGDRLDDLASVQMQSIAGGGFTMHVALNLQRNGRLQPPLMSAPQFEYDKVSQRPQALASGDLNGDRCRDLVIAAAYEGLLFLKGRDCNPRTPTIPDERGFKEPWPGPTAASLGARVIHEPAQAPLRAQVRLEPRAARARSMQ